MDCPKSVVPEQAGRSLVRSPDWCRGGSEVTWYFLLVAERSIDEADRISSGAVAPDVVYDGLCCRMRLRHGGDMRRYDHLRMGPEGVAFRQRLGIGNIEHGCCQAAAVERLDECALVKLLAAANMQQPC